VDVVPSERGGIPVDVTGLRGDVGLDPQRRKSGDDLVDVAADPAPVRRQGGRVEKDAHHW
jgi:hypothetical protein